MVFCSESGILDTNEITGVFASKKQEKMICKTNFFCIKKYLFKNIFFLYKKYIYMLINPHVG